ncbi:FkbM family methyltransferase [Reichenbachiella sp.]|uniref:FkbM family methyltransferase n=1 Tax=Reichenbachiella sp. TaxID=2184521 RepID=UPI003B5B8CBD
MEVINQIFFNQCYIHSVSKFKQLYPNLHTPIIFDLGAYTGISCLYFKTIFPSAKIFCLEPDAENYQLLKNNIQNNQVNQVSHAQAAVWDKNTKVAKDKKFRDGKEWSVVYQEQKDGSVNAFDMDTLMQSRQLEMIDFMKMDIEGAEQMLLGSLETAESFLPNVRFIAFELHREFLSEENMKSIFDQLGFETVFGTDISFAWNKNLLHNSISKTHSLSF